MFPWRAERYSDLPSIFLIFYLTSWNRFISQSKRLQFILFRQNLFISRHKNSSVLAKPLLLIHEFFHLSFHNFLQIILILFLIHWNIFVRFLPWDLCICEEVVSWVLFVKILLRFFVELLWTGRGSFRLIVVAWMYGLLGWRTHVAFAVVEHLRLVFFGLEVLVRRFLGAFYHWLWLVWLLRKLILILISIRILLLFKTIPLLRKFLPIPIILVRGITMIDLPLDHTGIHPQNPQQLLLRFRLRQQPIQLHPLHQPIQIHYRIFVNLMSTDLANGWKLSVIVLLKPGGNVVLWGKRELGVLWGAFVRVGVWVRG